MNTTSVKIQQVPIVSAIAPGVVHYYTTTATDSPTNLSNLSLTTNIFSSSGPVAYQQLPHPQALSLQSVQAPAQLTQSHQQQSATLQQQSQLYDISIATSAIGNAAIAATNATTTVQLLNNLNQTYSQQCSLLNVVNQVITPNNYFNFIESGKEIMVRRLLPQTFLSDSLLLAMLPLLLSFFFFY